MQSGRACDGYASHRLRLPRRNSPPSSQRRPEASGGKAPIAIRPAPTRSPLKLFRNEEEGLSFEFFCSNSIPQTNRLVDSAFWSGVVLQVASEEPAIRSSVFSLGALQRHFELKQEQEKVFAISLYARAVHDAQEIVRRASESGDHTRVLICAILFHCIENALGDHISAKNHLRSGLRLIHTYGVSDKDIRHILSSTYRRLDSQAMTFWDISAPYEFDENIRNLLEATPPPGPFSSLSHAANTLLNLMQWMYYIHERFHGPFRVMPRQSPEYTIQLGRCQAYMDAWNDHFEEYKDKHGSHLAEFRQKSTLLSIYHILASMQVRHFPTEPETQWDLLEPDFIRLIDLAEVFGERDSVVFARGVLSFEMGVIVPLFETAIRCRDPYQRRRAVAMLRSKHRREGMWDSFGAANVAQAAIDLEEAGLPKVEKASDVPDQQRIHFVDPAADLNRGEVQITFYSRPRLAMSASGEAYYQYNSQKQLIHF